MPRTHLLLDSRGRTVRDLRVSVTDRCEFRCHYCLPATEAVVFFERGQLNPTQTRPLVSRASILTFEEIERVVRVAVGLGVSKVRLTGGEPLLRREIETLVVRLARIAGLSDLAMSSNGLSFALKAQALRDAGLQRISFSLDSLDRANFERIAGCDGLESVLAGINAAQKLGFNPVKINTVLIRGLNDHELEALADFGRRQKITIRFIEFMPLDSSGRWRPELVVPGREILARLRARYSLEPVVPENPSETAKRWRFPDGESELGIIASVTEPFCASCNRLRMTADGQIRTCLFSTREYDLRARLRGGASDQELADYLREIVWQKEPRHQVGRADFVAPDRSMSSIGG